MPIVEGKYELTSSEKFEEYMKAIGVGLMTRKLASNAKPTTEVKKTGDDEYYFKTSTTFKTSELKFKLGQEFTEETADGRTCQSTITLEGDRVKHVQNCKDSSLLLYRDFVGDEMRMTLEVEDPESKATPKEKIICTRIYKKVA